MVHIKIDLVQLVVHTVQKNNKPLNPQQGRTRFPALFSANVFFITSSLLPTVTWAQIPPSTPVVDVQQRQWQQQIQDVVIPTTPTTQAPESGNLHFSSQELLAQPAVLEQLLDHAIEQENIELIQTLLPLYQQLAQKDPILQRYAQAILAESTGDFKQAIALYRHMIADKPELTPMRVRLAWLLLRDKQTVAGQAQFEKILSDATLPDTIRQQIQHAQTALKQQQNWSLQTRIRYLDDKNINQAPKQSQYGHWQLPTAKAGQGVGYDLMLSKTQPLFQHWALRYQLSVDGKSYWNQHDFDDISTQLQLGLSHRQAQREWSLAPLYQYRWFAQQPYSQSVGVRGQASQIFSEHLQGFLSLQYQQNRHHDRQYLDGKSAYANLTGLYFASPQRTWFWGVDGQQHHHRDVSEDYRRWATWFAWEQEWHNGISSNLSLGTAWRHYNTLDLFQIQRQDREYFAQVSAWHRAIAWRGLTPRWVWAWQRVDSNHFMYGYQKHNVFMEVSKRF